jgi:hypothetical protein
MDDFDEVFQPQFAVEPTPGPLDLADEADWEERVEYVTLEEAGLEESASHADGDSGVIEYVEWVNEGEDARDWLTQ